MPSLTHTRLPAFVLALLAALFCAAPNALAQDEFDEDAPDPVRLFRQGQKAHVKALENKSKEELEAALEFYERAVKLDPEFPEAEYQRALVLAVLERLTEAEKGLRRAMELKPDWALPVAALGQMLARMPGRDRDAESMLRRALSIDARNASTLVALAELRKRAGDNKQALEFVRRATEAGAAENVQLWIARGEIELAEGDRASALKSFTRVLSIDARDKIARIRRAEIYAEEKQTASALKDLQMLEEPAREDAPLALAVANLYARLEDKQAARRVLGQMPESARRSADAQRLSAVINQVACEDTPESRASLEKILVNDPKNASLLACLGMLYRTSDPQRALDYYKRAAEIEPSNIKYATGYSSALLQLRKFAEAATILQRIVRAAPDDYVARANFAVALYELKLYKEAIDEYKWMAKAMPDNAVIYYFIGSAHDHIGEYEDALRSYQAFLARADAQTNQLEIDKVNLRLPTLRNQIKRGEGVKKKRR